jgi:hypothetical protein
MIHGMVVHMHAHVHMNIIAVSQTLLKHEIGTVYMCFEHSGNMTSSYQHYICMYLEH